MHVTSRPMDTPVVLFEEKRPDGCCLRVLIFQEGLLPQQVLTLLGKLLRAI